VAEGNIDNVSMRLITSSGTPQSPTSTLSPTVITGGETPVVTPILPTLSQPPVTTQKSTPVPLFIAIFSLIVAGFFFIATRK